MVKARLQLCFCYLKRMRHQYLVWSVQGLSSVAIDCPEGIWDSHESYGMALTRGGCTLLSHGVPTIGLCPSCPSRPSVPKGRTDSEGISHGVPSLGLCPSCSSHPSVPKGHIDSEGTSHGVSSVGWPLSQLSVPSLSPQGTYRQ